MDCMLMKWRKRSGEKAGIIASGNGYDNVISFYVLVALSSVMLCAVVLKRIFPGHQHFRSTTAKRLMINAFFMVSFFNFEIRTNHSNARYVSLVNFISVWYYYVCELNSRLHVDPQRYQQIGFVLSNGLSTNYAWNIESVARNGIDISLVLNT